MDISVINDMIDDLEKSEPSLSNIRNLSALYNVRANLLGTNKFDKTTKELSDILPSYLQYIDVKRKYQLHEVNDEALYLNMKELCREIQEFIRALYSGSDTQRERDMLRQLIKDMR